MNVVTTLRKCFTQTFICSINVVGTSYFTFLFPISECCDHVYYEYSQTFLENVCDLLALNILATFMVTMKTLGGSSFCDHISWKGVEARAILIGVQIK